jgi:hypothetical protein
MRCSEILRSKNCKKMDFIFYRLQTLFIAILSEISQLLVPEP